MGISNCIIRYFCDGRICRLSVAWEVFGAGYFRFLNFKNFALFVVTSRWEFRERLDVAVGASLGLDFIFQSGIFNLLENVPYGRILKKDRDSPDSLGGSQVKTAWFFYTSIMQPDSLKFLYRDFV